MELTVLPNIKDSFAISRFILERAVRGKLFKNTIQNVLTEFLERRNTSVETRYFRPNSNKGQSIGDLIILTCNQRLNYEGRRSTWSSRKAY